MVLLLWLTCAHSFGQQYSVARLWNEELLSSIRKDLARPTVHARNLFHLSAVMYDAWAVYDDVAQTWLLGNKVGNYQSVFNGIAIPADVQAAREEAISFAAYRLLKHRFKNTPGGPIVLPRYDSLMNALGYDTTFVSTDYSNGDPAALGNYIAEDMIAFGMQDGANEENDYAPLYYEPINPVLLPATSTVPDLVDPNRWQPLGFDVFIDQSGNEYAGKVPEFVGPEWGSVVPFSLKKNDLKIYQRDGHDWWVYHDPGRPPYIDLVNGGTESEEYKWSFELVSRWSAQLDATDGVMWDISPASIGNIQSYPDSVKDYANWYKLEEGGDPGQGYSVNPKTGQPYAPQIVPRGDYARILAEFWADGPSSETPPGHWFVILNYVNDHPLFEKRFEGTGPVVDDLEWDVKAYLALGGCDHDAAITAWGIKGYYDYIRPISAIRYMCKLGQCTDSTLSNYNVGGIDLIPGYIEVVQPGDPLAGSGNENVGKIKLFAWRGHDYVPDPKTDVAGVGWILAENWWPYQRPTFVTPPFAGYISGHSTYSRAAAELITLLTGDPYFPGGIGEFFAPQNEFLVFEDGPTMDCTLQWAKYFDASDQCSLSRIWGGIHPPVDDIPGRKIGMVLGPEAFTWAKLYWEGKIVGLNSAVNKEVRYLKIFPNPILRGDKLQIELSRPLNEFQVKVIDLQGVEVLSRKFNTRQMLNTVEVETASLNAGLYIVQVTGKHFREETKVVIQN